MAMPIFATFQDAIDYLAINGALPAVAVDSSRLDVDRDRIVNAATGPEIEITEEMVRAGCAELRLCDSGDPPWSTVRAIYIAMTKARLGELKRANWSVSDQRVLRQPPKEQQETVRQLISSAQEADWNGPHREQ
jgi:uncharacterized protein (DUF2336 family)